MKGKKRGGLIAVMVLIAALIVVGMILEHQQGNADAAPLSYEYGGIDWEIAAPTLYETDGVLYIANGESTMALPGAALVDRKTNSVLSGNGRWLFYMADVNPDTGTGTLMRVAADATFPPVPVDDGVCAAEVSGDGRHVLIIKNIDGDFCDISYCAITPGGKVGTPVPIAAHVWQYRMAQTGTRILYAMGNGTLVSWTPGGREETVAIMATPPYGIGFSPNAKNIYFVTMTQEGWALWVKLGHRDAVQVAKDTAESPNFFSQSLGNDACQLTDDGQLIYFGEETVGGHMTYVYKDGQTQAYEGYAILQMFDDGSFVQLTNYGLNYCADRQKEVCLSDNVALIPLFSNLVCSDDVDAAPQKRFLLVEPVEKRDPYWETGTLYDMEIGGGKVALCTANTRQYNINIDFTQLVYVYDETLYFMQKMDGVWGAPVRVHSGVGEMDSLLWSETFAANGDIFYLLPDAQGKDGLYRFAPDTGGALLLEDVSQFNLFAGVPYALTGEGALYCVEGDVQKLADGVSGMRRTSGGVYAITDDSMLYCGSGGTVVLADHVALVGGMNGITYRPPLTDETRQRLDALYEAAKQLLDALDTSMSVDAGMLKQAAIALDRVPDVPNGMEDILGNLMLAFSYIESTGYADIVDMDENNLLTQAHDLLTEAIAAYEAYMAALE